MTKFVLVFLVGVVAGSIGIQLQEQRVEDRERQALAGEESRATTGARSLNGSTSIRPPSRTPPRPEPARAERVSGASEAASPDKDAKPDVPVTDAHEPLLSSIYDGRPLRDWHEKLEREEKDMTWSYEKEQRLTEFFTPPHGIAFDVRSIECRQTMCEVQAFALGPMQHNTITQDMQREPWYDFSGSFINLGEHGGSTSVLIYLLRQT